MVKSHLKWHQSVFAEVDRVLDFAIFEIPKVQLAAIFQMPDFLQIKARHKRIGCRPLAGNHYVVARLIPEIVVKFHATQIVLPAANDLEILVQV